MPTAQDAVYRYAERVADELQPILNIEGVTDNTQLLGAYTEAALRSLIRRTCQTMRVCRGGILDYPQEAIREEDIIIWAPHPAPAIFDVEGFGLVPRSSAFAVLEVKKSNYSGADVELERFVSRVETPRLAAEAKHLTAMFPTRALGVVAALESNPSARLTQLIEKKQAVAIFDLRNGAKCAIPRNVVVLVNFLYETAWRYWNAHGAGPVGLITED